MMGRIIVVALSLVAALVSAAPALASGCLGPCGVDFNHNEIFLRDGQ